MWNSREVESAQAQPQVALVQRKGVTLRSVSYLPSSLSSDTMPQTTMVSNCSIYTAFSMYVLLFFVVALFSLINSCITKTLIVVSLSSQDYITIHGSDSNNKHNIKTRISGILCSPYFSYPQCFLGEH